MSNPVGEHPNAVVGGTSGAGGGALVVWLLSLVAGVDVDPVVAALIAGGVAGFTLLVGRKGLRGLARMLWRGNE